MLVDSQGTGCAFELGLYPACLLVLVPRDREIVDVVIFGQRARCVRGCDVYRRAPKLDGSNDSNVFKRRRYADGRDCSNYELACSQEKRYPHTGW